MKKGLIIFTALLLICSCSKNKVKKIKKSTKKNKVTIQKKVEEPKYQDNNNTPIGFYINNGNTLDLVTELKTNNIKYDTDIGVFQIYPSQDKQVQLNKDFGSSFFDKWSSLPNYKNLKIGFNLKYTLDNLETGQKISHTILDPNTAIKYEYDYILTFLYDDYLNRYATHYSHIEQNEYNDDTLFTSIKLYCSHPERIVSKVQFTVFTYDDPEDLDENEEYRGNSSYTIEICAIGKTCD